MSNTQTNAVPPKACKRLPAGTDATLLAQGHQAKMMLKKAVRKIGKTVEFIPMPNGKIQRWMRFHLIQIGMQNAARVAAGIVPMTADQMQAEAQRRACRFLPAPAMVSSHKVRPSKSDNPEYRKPTILKADRRMHAFFA